MGFEFVATNWTTKNYVFAPAAIYDGNRFDISYVRYAPYITDWEMPRKPNRPVVTTNIHHLNKNGKDAVRKTKRKSERANASLHRCTQVAEVIASS